ncbi:unnamed protein product [Parnassius mnemosyne]|uniref:Uncharacterized protein n=1 Tax=Parnassius mnemosyne TaxID=213953 RepID=A0AAV1M4C0_9NEOP
MQCVILFVLVCVATVAIADGQFYVPRAYYTIDAEGHASAPIPLRRVRRSLSPYPYGYSGAEANANANAIANGWGSNARANANANAVAGTGGWMLPAGGEYGAINPNALRH